MTSVLGARTRNENRKKASELGELIVEDLINQKKNNPDIFWSLNDDVGETNPNFIGYDYSIMFRNITGDVNYPNCGIGVTNCTEAIIDINWGEDGKENIKLNRFFYRQ